MERQQLLLCMLACLQEELAATRAALDQAQAAAQRSGAATPEALSEREREVRCVGVAGRLQCWCCFVFILQSIIIHCLRCSR